MKLHYTSGYHPEGDGQTEHTNQTLEQYLHVYCNYQQDNWALLLPLTEITYNNAPSAMTGISPFFANKGYHPNLTIHPEHDLTSSRAQDFVVDLDELHQELCQNFAKLSSMLNRHTKPRLTPNNFQHQTLRLETSYLSKHNFLEQCVLPRSSLRSFWVHLKSLHILVLTQSP